MAKFIESQELQHWSKEGTINAETLEKLKTTISCIYTTSSSFALVFAKVRKLVY